MDFVAPEDSFDAQPEPACAQQVVARVELPYLCDISAAIAFGFASSPDLYSLFYQENSGDLFIYRLEPGTPALRAVAVHTRTIAPGLSWLMPVPAGDSVFVLARTADRRLAGYQLTLDRPRIRLTSALVPLVSLANASGAFASAHHLITYTPDPLTLDMVLTAYRLVVDTARGAISLVSAGRPAAQNSVALALALPCGQPDDYFLAYLANGALTPFRVDARSSDITAVPLAGGSCWPQVAGLTALLAHQHAGLQLIGYSDSLRSNNALLASVELAGGDILVQLRSAITLPGGPVQLPGPLVERQGRFLSYQPSNRGGVIAVNTIGSPGG